MSGDNMGAEQTAGRAPSAQDRRISTLPATASSQVQQEESNSSPLSPEALVAIHKHRGTFADIKDLLSRTDRRRRGKEKVQESEDQFGADVARIATLVEIDSYMALTRFNEFSLPPQIFDTPEDILVSYATTDEKKDEKGKRKLRERVRLFTESTIKGTLTRLTDDIKVLYLDRGATQAEAGDEIDALTQHIVNGKKKVFGLLGKDQQMGILGMLSERRAEMLRDNMPHYMYHLTTYQEAAGLTDQQLAEKRRNFDTASEDEQVKMAAEARTKALAAMDRTRKANLDRLREIEIQEGKSPNVVDKEMEDLRATYRAGSLRQKERVIDRIKARKVVLSLPHLGEIARLRMALEAEDHGITPQADLGNINDDQSRLNAETTRIEELLLNRLSLGINTPFREISTKDMAEEVERLARVYGDPSLSKTFEKVRLLRTTPDEIFNL